jgi:hypothetical protein
MNVFLRSPGGMVKVTDKFVLVYKIFATVVVGQKIMPVVLVRDSDMSKLLNEAKCRSQFQGVTFL